MTGYVGKELELFKHARNWKKYYARFLTPFLKGDVLEVGAGIGESTVSLCSTTQNSWLCLEPDEQLAKEIDQKKEKGYLPSFVEVITGTLDSMATHRQFDTIIYIDVIEHIENDGQELQHAAGFLRPGGHIIILAPAHQYLFSAFDKAIGHFRRYNKKILRKAIPEELKPVQLRYLDSMGLLASLANKWFLKKDYPSLKQIQFWDNYIIPVSIFTDRIVFYSLGKTIIGIWQKQ